MRMLVKLFGDETTLLKHASSMTTVISRCPQTVDEEPLELDEVKPLLEDSAGLNNEEAGVLEMMAESVVLSHPADKGNESWCTRAQILAKIEGLERLENPSSVCQTALSIEYEANLREVVTTYKDRATEAMSAGDFTAVALNLESLEQLSAVQNAIVE